MKKLAKLVNLVLLSYIALAAVLTSCQHALVLYIVNNTGSDVRVVSYDTVGKSKEYSIKSGLSHEVASPTKLVVKSGNAEWEYTDFPALDMKYIERGGLYPDKFRFQIEADGAIYILSPLMKTVVTPPPPQPPGFPLRPK